MVRIVRILRINNGNKLAISFSKSLINKKYFSFIISIIFLFSLFSILFIPVLSAKNVSSVFDDGKTDVGVSSTPAVDKVSSTPAVSVVSDDSNDNTSIIKDDDNEEVTKSFKLIKNETIETNEDDDKEEETELSLESNIGNITENDKISVEVSEEDEPSIIIKKVDFSSSRNQRNVKLKVSNLKEEPAEIKNELNISNSSNIYKYLDIKLTAGDTYIGETGIQSMNFTFTVNKSWIDDNDIDKYTVTMMRYHNDTWQELDTTYLNETDDEMTFKAITPGLSIFAVVGDKVVVEESDEIIVEVSIVPWWMPATVIFTSTVALGLVIFKKRLVYNP